MQQIKLKLQPLHSAQIAIKLQAKRFNVLNCGRRFGKTTLGLDLMVTNLLKGYPVGWFSPTYKMLADAWRTAKNAYAPIISSKNENEHRIETLTLGSLDMWSLDDPDSSRGRKYKTVIIDEAAKVRNLEDAWQQVIRSTLADLKGSAWFLSTPKGLNYFYHLWVNAESTQEWNRWRYTTHANPAIPVDEIQAMQRELPERVFRQEIMAEFLEDGSYFQKVDQVAIIADQDPPDTHHGHYLVAGVDWALSNDYTVITVACRNCNRIVAWDRFNQIDFTYQRAKLIDICKRYRVSGCLPERNSIGQPNIELLRETINILKGPDGYAGFSTSATTKPGLIQSLASAFEHDGFLVPQAAAEELRSYEVELSTSGHPRFSAPGNMHDDWVMSLALTWHALTQSSSIEFKSTGIRREFNRIRL